MTRREKKELTIDICVYLGIRKSREDEKMIMTLDFTNVLINFDTKYKIYIF